MDQVQAFGAAKWIAATPQGIVSSPIFRKRFSAHAGEHAVLRIIGLGTYEAYLNGKRIGDEVLYPLNSQYEAGNDPEGEELAYRIWFNDFDVSDLLREGENTLVVLVGDGWYSDFYYLDKTPFGEKKLCFRLSIGDREIVSDTDVKWAESFVKVSILHRGEEHDYRGFDDAVFGCDYDDSEWESARLSKPVESNYDLAACPCDKVIEELPARLLYTGDGYRLYDAGRNLAGYPVMLAEGTGEVSLSFSEELNGEGTDLDETHMHGQYMKFYPDRAGREMYTRFTWLGFRYFKVMGDAEVKGVRLVHANVAVSSSFESDHETLNWIYNTFIHTQLCNMHRGIPSDCPHIERLGYTGDGQNCCRSVMHSLDAKEFYRKWIADISDCQDRKTGNVQYIAPYHVKVGGGVGGWGSAIVIVPYEFWRYYGDITPAEELYPGMLRYFDFLEAHSEYGLVTSGIPGLWWLGDWCTPPDNQNLPAAFVNTCFYVDAMMKAAQIAQALGKAEDVAMLQARIAEKRRVMTAVYYNSQFSDASFCGNVFGANAYALGVGMGNELTAEKMVRHYRDIGCFDAGIFGTEKITRRLFERGESELAFRLLTAEEPYGFGKWKKEGATSFREYWGESRSHSHPMFGAVVACMFEYILGIRQQEESCGYESILIAPVEIGALHSMRGHITTPKGKIALSYRKENGVAEYEIEIPHGVHARIALPGIEERFVEGGSHHFRVEA